MEITLNTINNIPDTQWIAGSDKVYQFTVYDENQSLKTITGATVTFNMSQYAQPKTIEFTKTGTVTGTSVCAVTLVPSDTIDMGGKYIFQVVLELITGITYIPAQGIITITPKIQ